MGFWSGDSGNKSVSLLSKEQKTGLKDVLAGYGQALNNSYVPLSNYAADPNASNTFARNGGEAAFDNMIGNIRRNEQNSYNNLANSALGRFSTAMAGQKVNLANNATDAINTNNMNKFGAMSEADRDAIEKQMGAMGLAQEGQLGALNVQTKENQQTYKPGFMDKLGTTMSVFASGRQAFG